jgi:hypothetical protein
MFKDANITQVLIGIKYVWDLFLDFENFKHFTVMGHHKKNISFISPIPIVKHYDYVHFSLTENYNFMHGNTNIHVSLYFEDIICTIYKTSAMHYLTNAAS